MGLSRQSNANQPKMILGYYPQTSIAGAVIPVLYGTRRVAGNVIWTGDWTPVPRVSGGKNSGKASSGKTGGGQYDYQTAIIIGLVFGPIDGIRTVWKDRTAFVPSSIGQSQVLSGTTVPAGNAGFFMDMGVTLTDPYSVTVNDYGSPGSVTLTGNQQTPMAKVSGSPAAGEYAVDGSGNYTFNAADIGKTVTIQYVFTSLAGVAQDAPIEQLSLTLFTGERGQSPWSWLVSNHPDQVLGYTQLAYVASEVMKLDSSGTVSNFSWEIAGRHIYGGISDCDPAEVFADFLCDGDFGPGFPSAWLDSVDQFSFYCRANGIFCSPLYDRQQTAAAHLAELLIVGNAEAVWSDGKLKTISRGDTTAVGNGATFSPSTQPVYDLDDNDWIAAPGDAPNTFQLPRMKDSYNYLKVLYSNRGITGANGYQETPIPAQVDYAIRLFGLREASPISIPSVCQQEIAAKIANVQVKRLVYERGILKGTLGMQYCLLEPMDMITVTDPYRGWVAQPFWINSIEENEGGELSIEATLFPWSIAQPTLHPKQPNTQFQPPYYANPGSVNVPIFYEVPPQLANAKVPTDYVLAIMLSGGQNWGGCSVYLSTDNGASYDFIGKQIGKCKTGALTANLPYHANPDNSNTLSVNLTESGGVLENVPQKNFDADLNPMVIDNELITYRDASLVSGARYDLTILHRRVFETVDTDHLTGARVGFLDGTEFRIEYSPEDLGKTWFLKFTSFNSAGQQEQNIADVTAYPFCLTAPHVRGPLNPKMGSEISNVPSGYSYQISQPEPDVNTPTRLQIYGWPPVNQWSPDVVAPIIDPTGTVSFDAGGAMLTGNFLLGVCTVDSAGRYSRMSNLMSFTITSSTSKVVFGIVFPNGSTKYQIFMGEDIDSMVCDVKRTGTPSSITVNYVIQYGYGPPDPRFDHVQVLGSWERHAGVLAANVLSVTSGGFTDIVKIGLPDGTALTSGQFNGYYISLLSRLGFSSTPTAFQDQPIIATATDGSLTLVHPTGLLFQPGDLITIRAVANISSATTIGCTGFANVFSPGGTGLATDAEKDSLIWITFGLGLGQIREISSNTGTTCTIKKAWITIPDSTSRFIIVQKSNPINTPTSPITVTTFPNANSDPNPNLIADLDASALQGYVALIRVLASDVDGNLSAEDLDSAHERYIIPSIKLPGFVTVLADSSNNVVLDVGLLSPTTGAFNLILTTTPGNIPIPVNTKGPIIEGMSFSIHFPQPGNKPGPVFDNSAGGFASDINSADLGFAGFAGTFSCLKVRYTGGMWIKEYFTTGGSTT